MSSQVLSDTSPSQLGHEHHGLVWAGTALATTRQETLERAHKPILSASTANRVLECPAKHLASAVIAEQQTPLDPAPLGNAIHDVLEQFYTLDAGARTEDSIVTLTDNVAPRYVEPLTEQERRRWRTQVLTGARGIFELENPSEIVPVQLEASIDAVEIAPGIRFRGFIDRVRNLGDAIAIDDYKTGKYKAPGRFGDNYGDQVRAYSIAAEVMFDKEVSEGTLLYTTAKRRRIVDLSQPAKAKTLRRYRDARETLDESYGAGRYEAQPGPLCGWCPLVRACPVAQVKSEKAIAQSLTQPDVHVPEHGEDYELATGARDEKPVELHEPAEAVGEVLILSDRGEAREDQDMTITMPSVVAAAPQPENRPYEEYVGNGELNPASYAAGAVASVMRFSIAYVRQATEHNFWLQLQEPESIRTAFAHTIATVIFRAQARYGGSTSWQSNTNKHIRMFVFEALDRRPFPFGAGDLIPGYLAGVEKYAVESLQMARGLYDNTGTDYNPAALEALTK